MSPAREETSVMAFVELEEPEWEAMWGVIEQRYGDTFCECPDTHELWQYMGSFPQRLPDGGGVLWHHEYRHRSLNGHRTYAQVPATPGWRPTKVTREASA